MLKQWSERLSDRIRAALDAGDRELARRLALEGDGEARSLAKEYTLMYKGLGITVRVLLGLLGDLFGRGAAAPGAERALTDLLARFRADMIAALHRACPDDAEAVALGEATAAAGDGRLRMELDATAALLPKIGRASCRERV